MSDIVERLKLKERNGRMSDIVERLKLKEWQPNALLCEEAAAEILRLRVERAELRVAMKKALTALWVPDASAAITILVDTLYPEGSPK